MKRAVQILSVLSLPIVALLSASKSGAAEIPTVAISYFDNTAGTPEMDSLRKGLADMLLTDLSNAKSIRIVEREKLEALLKEIRLGEGKFVDPKTAQKLGKGLGAQYVLTGSYMIQGAQMRIDARLLRVESGEVVMAEQVTGGKGEFFAMEKDLANLLVSRLGVSLTSAEKARLGRVPTESFEAVLSFSKGLDAIDRHDNRAAESNFKAAIALDPGFARARALLEGVPSLINDFESAKVSAEAKTLAAMRAVLGGEIPDAAEYEFMIGVVEQFRSEGSEKTLRLNLPEVVRKGGSPSDWAAVLLYFRPLCANVARMRLHSLSCDQATYFADPLREYLSASNVEEARDLRWRRGATDCLLGISGRPRDEFYCVAQEWTDVRESHEHSIAQTLTSLGRQGFVDDALTAVRTLRRSPRLSAPLEDYVDSSVTRARQRCIDALRDEMQLFPPEQTARDEYGTACEEKSARREELRVVVSHERFALDYDEAELLLLGGDLAGAIEILTRTVSTNRERLAESHDVPSIQMAVNMLQHIASTLSNPLAMQQAQREQEALRRQRVMHEEALPELKRATYRSKDRNAESAWTRLRRDPEIGSRLRNATLFFDIQDIFGKAVECRIAIDGKQVDVRKLQPSRPVHFVSDALLVSPGEHQVELGCAAQARRVTVKVDVAAGERYVASGTVQTEHLREGEPDLRRLVVRRR